MDFLNPIISYLKLINIYYSLTLGIIPNNNFVNYEDQLCFDPKIMYHANMEMTFKTPKEIFFIGGGYENHYVKQGGRLTFTALQDAFIFSTGIKLYNIQIGYTHYCTHPLAFSVSNTASDRAKYGAYDEIYIKIGNLTN